MRSITVRAVFALASIIPTLPLAAQQEDGGGEAARPVVQATRLTAGIVVDGRLEDAAWASARVVTGFTQVDPEEGRPVSQPTEARILFDDEALYVGLRLFDDQPVSTRLGRRDMDLLDADWVGVVIDSYHDHRTAYSFDVNPSGVQRDATKSMSTRGHEQDDLSWDAVWDAAASIDDDGWTAEYRIPFSQLRFAASADPTWGIQIERVIGRRREYAVLSFTPKSEQGGIPTYGHLVGMNDVRPGKRLEVLPYAVQRSEYVGDGVRPPTNGDHSLSGGMDLLYRVTSDFTLNATANPDFGQVEVDPAVINLSVYETFYEEKRPFFVEGSEIFDFGRNTSGGQIFYSRRIGRRPQIGLPRGVTTVEVPDNTSILGAAKLSGKTSGGWSVGVMEAVTAEERGHFLDTGGLSGDAVVEPLANYLVSRVRKDSEDGRTSIGGMFTAANRRLPTDELRAVLRDGAYAGGIDFRHEFANRTWVVQGSAVGSRVEGDVRSLVGLQRLGHHFFQRPDADHLGVDSTSTSMSGYSVGLSLGKQAGRHWRTNLAVAATSPRYEVNDLGFQTRTDRRDVAGSLAYIETQPGSFLRSYYLSGNARLEKNYSGQKILNFYVLSGHFQHLNWWGAQINLMYFARALDDRSTRGGPLMERPANWSLNGGISSDRRKSITYSAAGRIGSDSYGGWNRGVEFDLGLKLSPWWTLSLHPFYMRSRNEAQYLFTAPDPSATTTYGARYVFAPLEQTTVSMETRLNVTFTPRLSLQLYSQPFVAVGDFGGTRELAAPETYDFTDTGNTVDEADFNFRSLRSTAVLRWEWRPGSTLFLAWQQAGSGDGAVGDFDLRRDVNAIWRVPFDDIFVIKVNYWINP